MVQETSKQAIGTQNDDTITEGYTDKNGNVVGGDDAHDKTKKANDYSKSPARPRRKKWIPCLRFSVRGLRLYNPTRLPLRFHHSRPTVMGARGLRRLLKRIVRSGLLRVHEHEGRT